MLKYLLLSIFFIFPFILNTQIQVSDIQFIKERIDHPRKGFIPFENKTYFIEQGKENTRISIVHKDSLELIHVVTDRPLDQDFNVYSYASFNFTNSNSGLNYESNILFELYPSYIYAIDITTGQVDYIADLGNFDTKYKIDFFTKNEKIYFQGTYGELDAYFEYDPQSEDLIKIEISENKSTFRIGSTLHFYSSDSTQIISFDLETEAIDTLATAIVGQFQMEYITLAREQQIIVKEDGSGSIYLIDNSLVFSEINCLNGTYPDDIYITSDFVFYSKEDNYYSYVLDRHDCSQISNYFSYEKLYFRDSKELFDEYLLLSSYSDWSGTGKFVLYDIETETFSYLDLVSDQIYTDQAIRYDNKLYTIAADEIHYYGTFPEIIELNLENKQVNNIDNYEKWDLNYIVLGEYRPDEKLNIYYNADLESTFKTYDHNDQVLHDLYIFDYLKNVGIDYQIFEHIWHDDKLFFYCSNGMHVMENGQSTKLIDVGTSEFSYITSGFIIRDNNLHFLMQLDSAVHKITLDLADYSFEQKVIEGIDIIDYRKSKTENSLVNIPNNSTEENSGYYDLRDETFKPFLPAAQRISEYSLSGNNVLLRTFDNSWSIFNTVSETRINANISSGEYPEVFPDGNGGFFVVPWHNTTNYPEFTHLNGLGIHSTIVEDFVHLVYYDGERLDGPVKSLAFDTDNEVTIFSARNSEYYFNTFPAENMEYYNRFFWKQVDEFSILELPYEGKYNTYIFNFGEEQKNITPDGKMDRLLDAFIEDEKLVLLYQDKESYELTFEDYDFSSETMEVRQSLYIDRNYFSYNYMISDNNYILSLDDNVHGMEPWHYNSTTGELSLLKDIKEGFVGSLPREYMRAENASDIYFTAMNNKNERQLFKLDKTLDIQEIAIISIPLVISPSPTEGVIRINRNLKNIKVFNTHGQVVLTLDHYNKQAEINLMDLTDGIYYIAAKSENNEYCEGKFILHKE